MIILDRMIFTTRLALSCLMVALTVALCAQSNPPVTDHWQMSVGAQYGRGIKSNSFSGQALDAWSYGGNLAYALVRPKLTMTSFMYVGFQQLSAAGEGIVAPDVLGFEETLQVDNFIFGPGFELKLNNKSKYHPLLGAQAFFGVPISSSYTFQNTGGDVPINLPSFYEVKGGASLYTSGQLFVGVERLINEKIQLRVKGALGEHYQFATWQLPFPIFPFYTFRNAQLVKGDYWQASLEVTHRL